MIQSTLDYIVCPICLVELELSPERTVDEDIIEGKLTCGKCGHAFRIHGSLPILTAPGTKPYDWFARELTNALEQYEPREAIQMMADGEIRPKRLKATDPVLTKEELEEGDYKDSGAFLDDRFGGVKSARRHFREQHNVSRKVFEMMIEMGRLDGANLILDVGTGYGYMLQFLAEELKPAEIFTVGISYTNLKAVRGRFRIFGIDGSAHLVVADAHQPPFRDRQFEAVVSWGGQGNIVRFCDALPQMYRVLGSGGRLVTDIVGLEKADPDTQKLIEAVGAEFFQRNLRKLGLLSTKEEVTQRMKECGFRNIFARRADSTTLVSGVKRMSL